MRNDANIIVKINGGTFRCECGCNVFHRLFGNRLGCNGCDLVYIGE